MFFLQHASATAIAPALRRRNGAKTLTENRARYGRSHARSERVDALALYLKGRNVLCSVAHAISNLMWARRLPPTKKVSFIAAARAPLSAIVRIALNTIRIILIRYYALIAVKNL